MAVITEPPGEKLMNMPPVQKTEPLITIRRSCLSGCDFCDSPIQRTGLLALQVAFVEISGIIKGHRPINASLFGQTLRGKLAGFWCELDTPALMGSSPTKTLSNHGLLDKLDDSATDDDDIDTSLHL
ncbi:hypothetical protein D5086_028654 [Populus alba]|uniref:Uncharacterized protein n=1 Tax=Populus alba TaxID=43335 RepID=A0ACC4ARA3_POPAL